jgi:hypothetical protein
MLPTAGRDGVIGGTRARLWTADDGTLRLAWRGREHDLRHAVVRHRDDGGAIRFSVGSLAARYRRRGPTMGDRMWDALDFTADEPWTWEDGDFGLFVFHLATRTGPIKYRHLFDLPPIRTDSGSRNVRVLGGPPGHRGIVVSAEGLTRTLPGMREEAVRWDRLVEIRAKFELSGIWAESTLLTFEDGEGLAVVPVGYSGDAAWVLRKLRPRLRRLPGWDDAPLDFALEFATRDPVGPRRGEPRRHMAERPVWERPGG